MISYALLLHPGHNRVYFDALEPLCLEEIFHVTQTLDNAPKEIAFQIMGGVRYLTFSCDAPANADMLLRLARCSFFYALFEKQETALIPIEVPVARIYPESLNTMLKYSGKTNELFTRMMVGLALCHQTSQRQGRPALLDPMCGKGTTLLEGLLQDADVTGIELAASPVREVQTFLIKYLETGKYKHKAQKEKVSNTGGKKIADGACITLAPTKEQYAQNPQRFRILCADTRITSTLIKKKSMDAIVCDLPYGVQHGSKQENTLRREPDDLLKAALPSWKQVMKKGGCVVLAFNTFTLKKEALESLGASLGYEVIPSPNFQHRVDQSILRDLVILRA